MPKFFLYSKSNRLRIFFQNISVWKKVQNNIVTLRFVLVMALIIVGTTYLALINTTATRGFEVDTLTKQAESLKKDHEKLQNEVSQISSLNHIEEQSKDLNLVSVSKVEYASGQNSDLVLEK